jgi:hypothetical protein
MKGFYCAEARKDCMRGCRNVDECKAEADLKHEAQRRQEEAEAEARINNIINTDADFK